MIHRLFPSPRAAASRLERESGRPAGAALALLLALATAVPAAAAEPPATPQALAVTVVRPKLETLAETLLVTGTLLPREEIEVRPEIEGHRLLDILVEVGDQVKQGQVLARLSREVLDIQLAQNTAGAAKAQAAIAQQRAALDQAGAQLTEATASVDRARQLRKSGTVSQETLDERERAVKVATAQVAAANEALAAAEAEAVLVKAQRDEIEVRLKRTDVRAPKAGVILERTARIGAIATSVAIEPLFRISEDGAIDLDAEVPEVAMPRLKVGQSAAVTPAGFETPLIGRVRLISAEVDKSTRLGRAKIALPADPHLKPGAFARAVVETGSRDGLVVPQSAVMFDAEGAYVLKVTDGVIAKARVTPTLKAAGLVLLETGIGADDTLVARAGGFLRSGDKVTPVEAPATVGRIGDEVR